MTSKHAIDSALAKMIRGRWLLGLALAAGALAGGGAAQGAVFYLQELGTPHSLGTAGVANPTNTEGADAAWSNPAGLAYLKHDHVMAGVQLIVPNMRFDSGVRTGGGDDGGNAGIATAVPSLFYGRKLSDRLGFGLALAGTMGGGVDYGSDFAGRYSTIRAELGALGLSPAFGYRVNDQWSLGAGVSIIYTLYEQELAINRSRLPGGQRGDGRLKIEKADDIGYQPFFSVNYRPREDLLLSMVYRAEMDVGLTGDVKVKNVSVPVAVDEVDLDWDNPQWLDFGLRYTHSPQDTFYFNAGWQDWSEFSGNRLGFSGGSLNPVVQLDRNFDDTWYAGLAFTHKNNAGAIYSFGLSYESAPVEDADRTFDLPVDAMVKLSGAYSWAGEKNLDFSLGGTVYVVGNAAIDQTSQGVRVQGSFDSNTILFLGGTLRYRF